MQFQSFTVNSEVSGERLDICLTKKTGLSRNFIQNLIKNGLVRVNKVQIEKTGFNVTANDEIAYKILEKDTTVKAEKIKLNVIHEDEDLLVINKQAGLVVHPSDSGHSNGTILNAALNIDKNASLVHRLDKDTSGVLLIAKNLKTKARLSKLFKDRKVEKTYLALVRGVPSNTKGKIEAPLKRNTSNRMRISINSAGKIAITKFKVLEIYKNASLLEVNIETGRTHQIRVHMASIGHPIIGDITYGDAKINKEYAEKFNLRRQFLHAKEITIDGHTYKAELPQDLESVYSTLTQS